MSQPPVPRRIAVALSGGVDSLACLLLLKKMGHNPIGLHALLAPGAEVPAELYGIAQKLRIPFYITDLRGIFQKRIIEPFIADLQAGLTPNPCAKCNKIIKFGLLLEQALALGADCLATGHYCRLEKRAQAPLLAPAADRRKDQRYFLGLVRPKAFARTLFPLAGMTKAQCREFVAQRGFSPPIIRESQDICFLPPGGMRQFLREKVGGREGPIRARCLGQAHLPISGLPQIGVHHGLPFYTCGQRKGLASPWREPLYAREKDAASNTLVAAPRAMLDMDGCLAVEANYFLEPENWPKRLFCQLRYNQPPLSCHIQPMPGSLAIRLRKPGFASAPGQLAAIYDEEGRLLASAIISKIYFSNGE